VKSKYLFIITCFRIAGEKQAKEAIIRRDPATQVVRKLQRNSAKEIRIIERLKWPGQQVRSIHPDRPKQPEDDGGLEDTAKRSSKEMII
jgi:hypothetical protein